jgi:ATP-dependent exoDNAse (exonuclease V) beta subunit
VSRPGGIVKYDNLLRKCTSLAIKDSELEEALRLLYVAMTRARSKLYITASVTKQAEKRERYAYLSDILKEYELYSCNNHLEIILGACPSPLEFLDIRVITADDIEEKAAGDSSTCQLDTEEAERIKAQLKERFEFKYEFEHLEKIPSKLSISSLYPEILDDQDNAEHTKSYSVEDIPSFILEKEKSNLNEIALYKEEICL